MEIGGIPKIKLPSTAKNSFNILCAVNIKATTNNPAIDFIILDNTTDAAIFIQFVKRLIRKGILEEGDFFVLDNCTVHSQGDNIGLKNALCELYRITLIMLPPYSPELNPTELVFRTLLMRLRSERARYNCLFAADFVQAITKKFATFY